jgi:peptidoglycan/xylan/chitin deacetylase (PgdA/CDA1 family)
MIRPTVRAAALLCGLAAGPAFAADSAVVVMYHRFDEPGYASTNTRIDQLEAHIAELKEGGYAVLPLAEVVKALKSGTPLPDKAVAVTIDDAYASVYKVAWPRFKAAGIPVTLFLATDEVDANDGQHMTWDQIREARKEGLAIGSQTASHPHMGAIPPESIAADLAKSNKRFVEELGAQPELFAYPYGEASLPAMEKLKEAGYDVAFGQHSGVAFRGADSMYLPRFAFNEAYGDLARFRQAVRALPLPAAEVTPYDPVVKQNPPPFGFTVAGETAIDRLECYSSHEGRMSIERLGRRVEARAQRPFPPGRSRINCTLPAEGGRWRWFGYQYWVPEKR